MKSSLYLLYLILIICVICPSGLTDGFNSFKERIMKNSNDVYKPINRSKFNRDGRDVSNAYQQSPYRVPKRVYYETYVQDAPYNPPSLSDTNLLKVLGWILEQTNGNVRKKKEDMPEQSNGLKYMDGYFVPILKAD